MSDLTPTLDELESLLARQFELARRGEINSALEMIAQVNGLLARLEAAPPAALAGHADWVGRVDRAQRQLSLVLAARKQEAADELARLSSGRRVLRAYGET